MKTYLIRWRGVLTRDSGWKHVKATDLQEAKLLFLAEYPTRRIMSAAIVESPLADTPADA